MADNSRQKKIRIALPLSGFGHIRRGTEMYYMTLLPHLAKDPLLDITVFGGGGDFSIPGIRFVRVPCVSRTYFAAFPHVRKIKLTHAHDWEELLFASFLLPWMLPRTFDILVGGQFPYSLLALRAYRRIRNPRAKILFVSQGGTSFSHSRLFAADMLTAINPEYEREFQKKLPTALVPQCVDADFFTKQPVRRQDLGMPPQAYVILSASALEPIKRVDVLIEAVSKIPDAFLVIAGTGSEEEKLKKLGNERLGARVHFAGSVDGERLRAYYSAADVFVLPSLTEAFGNVLIEAMACALPVVAHHGATQRWVVDGGGEVDDISTPEKLRSGIMRIKNTVDAKKRYGQAGRAHVLQHFTVEAVAEIYKKLFRDIAL